MVLADGAAHTLVWSSKRNAGTKFCILPLLPKASDGQELLASKPGMTLAPERSHLPEPFHACAFAEPGLTIKNSGATHFCHDGMHGVVEGTAPMVLNHALQAIAAESFQVYQYVDHFQL